MFGPLTFEEENNKSSKNYESTVCLLCENTFNLNLCMDVFLKHILEVHHLVIEDVQNIENLPEYLDYWKKKFVSKSIESIVPSITIDSTNEQYFLLSSLLKDDKNIRHEIRLSHVLQIQEFERSDNSYKKGCLFCRLQHEGNRLDFVKHLSEQHNLVLGNPQNLVYVEEFINKLEEKLNNLQCLYCEKTFPERNILKEHMRKKLHKRIKPQNKCYDKYYMVNYLEVGCDWHDINKEDDRIAINTQENSDAEYSDWEEKDNFIACLFCEHRESDINILNEHLSSEHSFNYLDLTIDLDFYLKVKLVNYIRKQIYNHSCIVCDVKCENNRDLLKHLDESDHYQLPGKKIFDSPEYFFSTYENDAFLYSISEDD